MLDQRTLAAYHEAGHIACAFRFGALRIDWLHIRNNGINAGVCQYLHKGNSVRCRDAKLIEESMTITLAGLAAQQRYMLEMGLPYMFNNSVADCKEAMHLLKIQQRPPATSDPFKFWEIYGRKARDFVRKSNNWLLVSALAKELLAKRELTGQQAIDVMEGAAFMQALTYLNDSKTIRDFEQTLRRQGFSRKRALAILSKLKQIFKKGEQIK